VPAHQKGEVGPEAVVDEHASVAGNQAHALHRLDAAFGIKVIGGQVLGPEDVQPVTLAVEGAACLILVAARPLRAALGLSMSLRSIRQRGQQGFAQGPRVSVPWRGPLFANPV